MLRSLGSVETLPIWKQLVILIPMSLAFVYAVTCVGLHGFFRECTWGSFLPSLLPSLTVLAALIAAVCSIRPDQEGFFVVLAVVSISLSIFLSYRTRISIVQGLAPKASSDLGGKVVLITGANTGIGKETAIQLAERGATVIMACRSVSKGEEAKKDIVESVQRTRGTEPTIDIVSMDLSSLTSVKQAAAKLEQKKTNVDILILNAGVMMNKQVVTEDGYELTMQANHLGHYLLTRLLLKNGTLKEDSGVVLTLTSSTYKFVPKMDLDDLFCTKNRKYSLFGQYEMSKLANILFTTELDSRYPNLFTAAIHPGIVRTSVVRNMPWYLYYPNIIFAWALWTTQKTPSQGAWCTVHVAAAAVTTTGKPVQSGQYWRNGQIQELFPCAKDPVAASRLWIDSAKYVGLDA